MTQCPVSWQTNKARRSKATACGVQIDVWEQRRDTWCWAAGWNTPTQQTGKARSEDEARTAAIDAALALAPQHADAAAIRPWRAEKAKAETAARKAAERVARRVPGA